MNKKYWKNKKILITGASGFIGSHFVEELDKMGAKIKALYHKKNSNIEYLQNTCKNVEYLKVNLLEGNSIRTASQNVEIIINCAALDGNAEFKQKNAAIILDTNMRITSNILNAAVENGIPNIVLLSSAEVYPLTSKNPIKEEDDYKKNFDNTNNGYVLSKRYAEILGELYSKQYGINVFLPRLTNVYGPRDNFNEASNRVIPSMIKKVLNNENIEIWGNGKQIRQFIYVKDVVLCILNMIKMNKNYIINISSGSSVTIYDLAKKIVKISKISSNITLLKNKIQGISVRKLNIQLLKSVSPVGFHSLNEGLLETITYYKDNT
jgi:dTDP-4-dehydro-6-deoxy-alpha-D-gulose 4-ketoreductase